MGKQWTPQDEITRSVIPAQVPVATPSKSNMGSPSDFIEKANEPDSERFNRWFIEPLNRMTQHDGFILMIALFPLYERHLRILHKMKESDNFTENHKVFDTISNDLNISKKEATEFWSIFRNGLLHTGQPNGRFVFQFKNNKPIYLNDGFFHVNPLTFRDLLLPKINNKHIWKKIKIPKVLVPLGS